MKNEKTPRTTTRKSVVQAIAKQEKENKKKNIYSPEVQEAIRLKAYEIFIQRGCEHGNHNEDWIAAERIILGQ
jgi:hypothetical protein